MPRYTCYGLIIDSQVTLPELIESDSSAVADVQVRYGKIDSVLPRSTIEGWIHANQEEALLSFEDAGAFLLRGGKEIIVERFECATDLSVRQTIVGPVLVLLMRQRNHFILHACGVVINGSAVAFAADCGTGKSTTAAAFHAHGFPLIADDQIVIGFDADGAATVVPAYPQFKLDPKCASQFPKFHASESVKLLYEETKLGWRVRNSIINRPVPLSRIYILENSTTEEAVVPMSPMESFAALVEHTFQLEMITALKKERLQFQQISRLASGVTPVKRLRRRRDLALLPKVIEMVTNDLAETLAA